MTRPLLTGRTVTTPTPRRSADEAAFGSVTGAVAPAVWDGLAASEVYASSRWLRFCGRDDGA
ncbi:MAG TPA: hypothetical protein VGD67_09545, partial [Pseudonocardiaceae bacterium]